MEGKPLFYLLAKHGPWKTHVRVSSMMDVTLVIDWLNDQYLVCDKDYELLLENIQHPRLSKQHPIIFLNDLTVAAYIKLSWGI